MKIKFKTRAALLASSLALPPFAHSALASFEKNADMLIAEKSTDEGDIDSLAPACQWVSIRGKITMRSDAKDVRVQSTALQIFRKECWLPPIFKSENRTRPSFSP